MSLIQELARRAVAGPEGQPGPAHVKLAAPAFLQKLLPSLGATAREYGRMGRAVTNPFRYVWNSRPMWPVRTAWNAKYPYLEQGINAAAPAVTRTLARPLGMVSPRAQEWVNQQAPRTGPMLNKGLRLASRASMLGGIGFTGVMGARYLPDQMAYGLARTELGIDDPRVLNRIWWDTFKKQPEIAGQTVLPGFMGGDTTPIGAMHRQAIPEVMLPDLKYGPTRARERFPGFMTAADIARSTTPLGLAQTMALRSYKPEEPPLGKYMADIIKRNREGLANDPNLVKSPLLRSYADILLQPDVINNTGIKKTYDRGFTQQVPVTWPEYRITHGITRPLRQVLNKLPEHHVKALGNLLPQGKEFTYTYRDWPEIYGNLAGKTVANPGGYISHAPRNAVRDAIYMPVATTLVEARKSLGPTSTSPLAPLLQHLANTGQGRKARGTVADALERTVRPPE